jgi:acyl-CoA synthetase (NDP forming)
MLVAHLFILTRMLIREGSANLRRLLRPRTVAVVGANESLAMSNNAVRPMLAAGVDVRMVNPRRDEVYGLPCAPSLTSLGGPVDAVLALVNAERSVETVHEAAELGCAGVVVAAAGFAEANEAGASLQRRLKDIADSSGIAVVGPNCSGYINAQAGINMFTGGAISPRPGGIGIVSQSGFLVRSALAAAGRRQLGVSIAVSSGNEAVCGLHDYIDVLADDAETSVICLVVEKIRAAAPFFAAVRHAREQGTAVIALKLGRTESARTIIQSHTGAIADAAWVYDLAFREHGILAAHDIDEMLDMAQLFDQLPAKRWRPMRRAALITSSGGVSALAADLAVDARTELPAMPEVAEWVRETIPGAETVNPLDMTGFVVTDRAVLSELFTRYATAESVDLLGLCWWVGQGDASWGRVLLEPFTDIAATSETPCIVTSLEDTAVGEWTHEWKERGLTVTAGVRSLYRAMDAMTAYTTYVDPGPADLTRSAVDHNPIAATPPGTLVPFAQAMDLLDQAGIPTAAYVLIPADAAIVPDVGHLGDDLVVKLADVAHRTELGAVSLGVDTTTLESEVHRLREIAAREGVPATVVVQERVTAIGEAFTGLQIGTDLGSFLLFGRGGVLVETTGGVSGRMLPLGRQSARALVEEVAGTEAMARYRGQAQWPKTALVDTLLAVDRLWARLGSHASSVDINPLVVTADGVVAVDALIIANG